MILLILSNSLLQAMGQLMIDSWGGLSSGIVSFDTVVTEGAAGLGAILRLLLPLLLGLMALSRLIGRLV